MKKGQIGVDDAWRDSHLVNSIKLEGQWEGPFLTLSSQKRPTLSRTRRGNVEKEETVDEAAKLVLSLLTLVVLLKSNQPPVTSPLLFTLSPFIKIIKLCTGRSLNPPFSPSKAAQPRTSNKDTSTCQTELEIHSILAILATDSMRE